MGSGTIVLDGGHVLTNDHVASNDASCEMTIWGVNSIKDIPDLVAYAESIPGARDQRIDLAVVRLVNERGNPIKIPGRSPIDIPRNEITLGTPMKLLGFPGMGGVRISMTPGEQSGWWEDEENLLWSEMFYKTSAKMGPGISGGAAFNAETGEFVGIPTGTPGPGEDGGDILGLVRPGRYALPLLDAAERAG
jgi:S1-C subfamily serine protease